MNERQIPTKAASQMRFWEFSESVRITAPDSALPKLEALAEKVAGANWGVELTENSGMHFRFADQGQAFLFCLACGYT